MRKLSILIKHKLTGSSKNDKYKEYGKYTEILHIIWWKKNSETSVNELLIEGPIGNPNGFFIKSKIDNC